MRWSQVEADEAGGRCASHIWRRHSDCPFSIYEVDLEIEMKVRRIRFGDEQNR